MAENDQSPPPSSPGAAVPATPPSDAVPPEAVEAIRKMTEHRPGASLGISMAMGTPINPIQQKVTESHITLVLETAKLSASNEFELKKREQDRTWWQSLSDRVFELIVLMAFVGLIIFVIHTFQSQTAILIPILTGIGGLFTGLLAGIGYGKKGSQK